MFGRGFDSLHLHKPLLVKVVRHKQTYLVYYKGVYLAFDKCNRYYVILNGNVIEMYPQLKATA